MFDQIKPSTKLYLLVFIVFFFIIGIGVYGIQELKKMNQNTQTLYADRVIPMEQLTIIRYEFLVNILAAAEQSQADRLAFRESLERIAGAEKNINENWKAYIATLLTTKEFVLVKQAASLMTGSNETVEQLKEILSKQDARGLDNLINSKLYPAINPVVYKLNELINLQVSVGKEIHKGNATVYQTALKQFIFIILISLLLAVPFSYYLVGKIKDLIENLHQGNKNLAKSERKYRTLIEYAGDAIFVFNTETRIIDANEYACRLLGYGREELLQMKFPDLLNPDEQQKLVIVLELIKKGVQRLSERKIKKKDGSEVVTEINTRLLDGEGYISIVRDITERKRSEEIVKESERKYRNIFENVQDVFFQTTIDGIVIEASPSIKYHTGFSREELIHSPVVNLYFDPADRDKGLAILQEKGVIVDYELKLKSSTDLPIYVSLNASLITGADGKPSHIDGVLRNISERKRMEENLLQSEARLKEAQAMAHMGNFEVDFLSNVHVWSDELYKIVGMTKEEIQPSTEAFLSFLHSADVVKAQAKIDEASLKLKNESANFRLLRKDGTTRYARIEWKFEFHKNGDPKRLYGIVQDITERKKAELSLKQSEVNYRQMFDLSPAPMWVYDQETYKFMQVNQAFIKNYGYSLDEFKDMTIMNISLNINEAEVTYNDRKKNTFNPLFMSGHRHRKKSGEIIDVETSSIPVILNGKKQILVVAIDTTEKNRYEHKLTRAAIKTQEDERYEIGGELHDNVCQLLATSLLYLGMLKSQLTPESSEFFKQTHQFISLASQEIRNLSHRLAPAFFDDGKLEETFQNLLINFNIEKKYAITLRFDEPAKSYHISRDLQLNLYRILQEQLRNIFKYANATLIEVEVTITDNTLQMKITDNGVGFEVAANKGGIGMANMNRRAQMFSGTFSVYSVPGEGCEIGVSIPLPEANDSGGG